MKKGIKMNMILIDLYLRVYIVILQIETAKRARRNQKKKTEK